MQRPVVDEPVMDLNQSADFVPSPTPPPQVMHNFMPMPIAEPFYPNAIQDEEEIRFSHFLRQNLQLFWHQQMMEIISSADFKSQQHLPLARVKRIMKSDPDVKMVSADTPILFAKACEIFILELTLRSWLQTEYNRRRTLQRCDITQALRRGEVYDFLIDIVPSFHQCGGQMDVEEGDGSEASIAPDTRRQNQEIPAQLIMEPVPTAAEFNVNPASQ